MITLKSFIIQGRIIGHGNPLGCATIENTDIRRDGIRGNCAPNLFAGKLPGVKRIAGQNTLSISSTGDQKGASNCSKTECKFMEHGEAPMLAAWMSLHVLGQPGPRTCLEGGGGLLAPAAMLDA